MKYFLKTASGKWEEVTEYVFKNRKYVLLDAEDTPRYGDDVVLLDGNMLTFSGTVSILEMGQLCRLLGVTVPTGSFGADAVKMPTTVRIKRNNCHLLHFLATGENYKKVA